MLSIISNTYFKKIINNFLPTFKIEEQNNSNLTIYNSFLNMCFLVIKCTVFTTYIIKDTFYIIDLSYERHLLNVEFCTGGPRPIEHMRCELKMGERILLQLMLIVKVVKNFVCIYFCK